MSGMHPVSDKIEHGYLSFYQTVAISLYNRSLTQDRQPVLVELGVRDGASMHLWKRMFPTCIIIGVDNSAQANKTVAGTDFIFSDQDDPQLPHTIDRIVRSHIGPPFAEPDGKLPYSVDVVIDDCSHDGKRTRASFDNLWPIVRPGGLYVIEDWYVGGPDFPDYDTSMLDLVHQLVDTQLDKHHEIDAVQVRYGLCAVMKRPLRRVHAPGSPEVPSSR